MSGTPKSSDLKLVLSNYLSVAEMTPFILWKIQAILIDIYQLLDFSPTCASIYLSSYLSSILFYV